MLFRFVTTNAPSGTSASKNAGRIRTSSTPTITWTLGQTSKELRRGLILIGKSEKIRRLFLTIMKRSAKLLPRFLEFPKYGHSGVEWPVFFRAARHRLISLTLRVESPIPAVFLFTLGFSNGVSLNHSLLREQYLPTTGKNYTQRKKKKMQAIYKAINSTKRIRYRRSTQNYIIALRECFIWQIAAVNF